MLQETVGRDLVYENLMEEVLTLEGRYALNSRYWPRKSLQMDSV